MPLDYSRLGKICFTVVAFATSACGGSTPPSAAPESPAADSAGEDNTTAASGESAQDSKTDASNPQAAVDGATANDSAAATNDAAATNGASLEFRLSPTGALLLNGVQPFERGGAAKLVQHLGSPTREKVYKSGEKGLYHDDEGIVLWTVAQEVGGVGVNFNWDGDEKFPETSFTGTLVLGDLTVGRETTAAQFGTLKGYSVSCLGDSMCAGQSERTRFVAGFEKGVITQLAFLPSKEK